MIAALLEVMAFVLTIASISLLSGLLRTSKTTSQATEEQHLAGMSPTSDDAQGGERLRTAS